jgi:hypothetical protein
MNLTVKSYSTRSVTILDGRQMPARTANVSSVVQLNIQIGLLQLHVYILGKMTVADTFTVRYWIRL